MGKLNLVAALWGLSSLVLVQAQPLSEPVSIPLAKTPNHLIIRIAIGTNPAAYPYVFDTGSVLFATALGRGPGWAGADYNQSPPGNTFHAAYGSGALNYSGVLATTTLRFPEREGDGKGLTVSKASVGIITDPPKMYPNWKRDIDTRPPTPPERAGTFGTLGAGLFLGHGTTGTYASVFGQIPIGGNLDQGFIVQSGGAESASGCVIVGLSRKEMARFPIWVKMRPTLGTTTSATGQTVKLYPETQLEGTVTLVNPRGRRYSGRVVVIADTGGLGLHIVRSTAAPNTFEAPPEFVNRFGCLRDGIRFTLAIPGVDGRRGLDWTIIAGQREYVNRIQVREGRQAGPVGWLNTGIALFHQFDVLFDMTRGTMAFRPATTARW